MTLSPETIAFLNNVLDQVQVAASDPNFETLCAAIVRARKELALAAAILLDPDPEPAAE